MVEITVHHDIHINNDDLKVFADLFMNAALQQQQINQLGEQVSALTQQLQQHREALQSAVDKEN